MTIATLPPPPETSRARMIDRARRLHEDGYTIIAATWTSNAHVTRPVAGQFTVVTPRGDAYAVDVVRRTCECVCWRRNGECKHLLGLGHAAIRQAHATRAALWPVRSDRRFAVAFMEAGLLIEAVEAARDACAQRRAVEAAREWEEGRLAA